MKRQRFGSTNEEVSSMVQGCLRIAPRDWSGDPNSDSVKSVFEGLDTALECGIDVFDHADIYGAGRCEELFGHWLAAHRNLREKIFIQTKCGVRPGVYDFSGRHIQSSVEASLKRLQIEQIDCILLHRPDVLMQVEEVGNAFDQLHAAGKVRYFGVSNHHAGLLELLRAGLSQPIVANQVELSLIHTGILDAGPDWNARDTQMPPDPTFSYCHQHHITIQAWSPVVGGLLTGRACPADNPRAEQVAVAWPVIQELAKEKEVSVEAVVIGWLLHHPAQIQPIFGTVNPDRIRASCQATDVSFSREQWYRLYVAGRGGRSMP